MTETDSAAPAPYPIGTPGQPWGDAERAEWLSRQRKQRDYMDDVVSRIDGLRDCFDVMAYGRLEYADGDYTLYALKSRGWRDDLPCALVTGGVHGYETSGVHGALRFAETLAKDYMDKVNLLVAPCISPWAYERIHRWNPHAIDPNRSFVPGSPSEEAAALMRLVADAAVEFLVHVDLHETTDSDEQEFRPALAARDGLAFTPGHIPDGFYVVGDVERPQPAFQAAIIAAVAEVTHIAQPDERGQIIGSDVTQPGVINYPVKALGLCAGVTGARFTTTTEVYPDSAKATPAICNAAQVAAVRAALDYALA